MVDDSEEDDIAELQRKIVSAKLPAHALTAAEKELKVSNKQGREEYMSVDFFSLLLIVMQTMPTVCPSHYKFLMLLSLSLFLFLTAIEVSSLVFP